MCVRGLTSVSSHLTRTRPRINSNKGRCDEEGGRKRPNVLQCEGRRPLLMLIKISVRKVLDRESEREGKTITRFMKRVNSLTNFDCSLSGLSLKKVHLDFERRGSRCPILQG